MLGLGASSGSRGPGSAAAPPPTARTHGASLTRRVTFTAKHRYWRPDWSAEQNDATFGACAASEPHEHAYVCDVTIGGPVQTQTGMIIDLGVLDTTLDAVVVQPLNGAIVNDAYEEFAPGKRIPTCEELARAIATRVAAALARSAGGAARVRSVTVAEDETLSATWTTDA